MSINKKICSMALKHALLLTPILLAPAPALAAACTPSAESSAAVRDLLADSIVGRDIIRQAAQRIGGVDKLRAIKRLRYITEGDLSNGTQNYDPRKALDPDKNGPMTRIAELNFDTRQHRRKTSIIDNAGQTEAFWEHYANGHAWTLYPGVGSLADDETDEATFLDPITRSIPALLILQAMDNLTSASWIGESCATGILSDVVEFSWNPGTRFRLHIDKEDKLVRRIEATASDTLVGDDNVFQDFEGEMIVDGISFPTMTRAWRRGTIYSQLKTAQVEINPALEIFANEPPARLLRMPPASSARHIGNGLYEYLTGITDYFIYFFDLGDGVAVFDAPISSDLSRQVEQEIEKTVGKPVKYVIASHFHGDHVGGLSHYVRQGVKVVATPENFAILSRYANASARLNGIKLPRAEPDFAAVDKQPLTLRGTNGQKLIIYRAPNISHVQTMLMAYHPASRTLVTADFFSEVAAFGADDARLAAWLKSPAAPKVDWLVGVHNRKISYKEVQDRAAAFGKAKKVQ
jgi:glyoxylase-like metal-dependent hydrolase (beta-lactamase superfamily II)